MAVERKVATERLSKEVQKRGLPKRHVPPLAEVTFQLTDCGRDQGEVVEERRGQVGGVYILASEAAFAHHKR